MKGRSNINSTRRFRRSHLPTKAGAANTFKLIHILSTMLLVSSFSFSFLAFALHVYGAPAQTPATALADPFSTSQCPKDFHLVRRPGGHSELNPNELAYIEDRKANVIPHAWKEYLSNVKSTQTHLPHYVTHILSGDKGWSAPNLGIATSGGGYRAAIFGAGILNTLDGRNASSAKIGTGGLLQAATYLSGLSGGAWLVSSLVQAEFPTIQNLVFGDQNPSNYAGWLAQFDVQQTNISVVLSELVPKFAKGFDMTFNDLWAQNLARHFLNGTTVENIFKPSAHGGDILVSDFAKL
jgi:lysophospholipase